MKNQLLIFRIFILGACLGLALLYLQNRDAYFLQLTSPDSETGSKSHSELQKSHNNSSKFAMVRLTGPTMGTSYTIIFDAGNAQQADLSGYGEAASSDSSSSNALIDHEALHEAIRAELKATNQSMSTYIKDSEISRFNQWDGEDRWFSISQRFMDVLAIAMSVAEKTKGVYDPTLAPLVNIWGFGPNKASSPPTEIAIANAKAAVGYQNIVIDRAGLRIKKMIAGVQLDLSSVAKGFGVDQVYSLVVQRQKQVGISPNLMVEIGGEVRAEGPGREGDGWRIGIEKPDINDRENSAAESAASFSSVATRFSNAPQRILNLQQGALATSGTYRNFLKNGSITLPHIIDYAKGRPIQSKVFSVSVLADTSAESDAWATALLAMSAQGVNSMLAFAERMEIAALAMEKTGSDTFEQLPTTHFKAYSQRYRSTAAMEGKPLRGKKSDSASSAGEQL